MDEAALNALSRRILDAAFTVHTALSPCHLGSGYTACLLFELKRACLRVQTEVPVPIVYGGQKLAEVGYRIDMLVEGELVIELKAVEAIAPLHEAQLVSYLKLSNKRLGLLINFNVPYLRDGIRRRVNKL